MKVLTRFGAREGGDRIVRLSEARRNTVRRSQERHNNEFSSDEIFKNNGFKNNRFKNCANGQQRNLGSAKGLGNVRDGPGPHRAEKNSFENEFVMVDVPLVENLDEDIISGRAIEDHRDVPVCAALGLPTVGTSNAIDFKELGRGCEMESGEQGSTAERRCLLKLRDELEIGRQTSASCTAANKFTDPNNGTRESIGTKICAGSRKMTLPLKKICGESFCRGGGAGEEKNWGGAGNLAHMFWHILPTSCDSHLLQEGREQNDCFLIIDELCQVA